MGVLATEVVEFRAAGLAELEARVDEFHRKFKQQADERAKLAERFTSPGKFVTRDAVRTTADMATAATKLANALKDVHSAAHWAEKNLTKFGQVQFNKSFLDDARELAKATREAANAAADHAAVTGRRMPGGGGPRFASAGASGMPADAVPRPERPQAFPLVRVGAVTTNGQTGVGAGGTGMIPYAASGRGRYAGDTRGTGPDVYDAEYTVSGGGGRPRVPQPGAKPLTTWERVAERFGRSVDASARLTEKGYKGLIGAAGQLEGAGKHLTRAGMIGAAAGGGLVARGFQGTVEGERFGREFDLLARELAGAFKPLLDGATRKVRDIRRIMERFDKDDQANVANKAVLAGGALAAGAAAKRFGVPLGRLPGLALLAKLGEQAAATVQIGQGQDAAEKAMRGEFSPDDFERLKNDKNIARVMAIADPEERKRAATDEVGKINQTLRDTKAQIDKEGFRGKLRMVGNELDTMGPVRLGIFGDGGKNARESAAALQEEQKKAGFFKQIFKAADNGNNLPQAPGVNGPNQNRDMVTLAQSGFNAVGGAYDAIQAELAKGGAAERDPVVEGLRMILLELQKQEAKRNNDEAAQRNIQAQIDLVNKGQA